MEVHGKGNSQVDLDWRLQYFGGSKLILVVFYYLPIEPETEHLT